MKKTLESNLPILEMAERSITSIDLKLKAQYIRLISFLHENESFRVKLRGKNPPIFGTQNYFDYTAEKFASKRIISPPVNSGKVTDSLLKLLFKQLNPNSQVGIDEATRIHGDFMILENKIGTILESYIAFKLEPIGWTWCSGDFVNKIDFLKYEKKEFKLLQVKNKDVTENSSSSKGRGAIPKWIRLKGKNALPNWNNFPDQKAKKLLSEDEFLEFSLEICKKW